MAYCELADCLDYDAFLTTEEHYDRESKSRPDWCPLKPLPEKNTTENDMTDYQRGWSMVETSVLMRLQER